MRKIKKMSGVLAMAITVAMTSMNSATVFAAEDVVVSSDNGGASDSSSTSDSASGNSASSDDSTSSGDSSSDDSAASVDATSDATATDTTTTDTTTDTATTDTTVTDTTVTDTTATDTTTDTTVADTTVADTTATDTTVTDATTTDTTTTATTTATDIASYAAVADDTQDTRQEVTLYLTNNKQNCHDGNPEQITVNLEAGDELNNYIKLNLNGGNFAINNPNYPGYAFKNQENLSSWCQNLPDGIDMVKYTSNTGASFARMIFTGRTNATGNFNVSITVPADRISVSNGYKISSDGLTVSFILNVDGVHIPVTAPVEEVFSSRSKHSHSSTPQVKESDYVQFCNEVAEQIKNAEENGSVLVETDKWVSFNQTVVDALDARSDVSLTLDFVYDEKEYQTVISAGAVRQMTTTEVLAGAEGEDPFDIPTPLAPMPTVQNSEEAQYYGFMYVGSIFGLNDMTE